ncbi:hypothetical protein BKM31_33420 [[Actinomadura] parvosata subsp. kistnae]|uniref:Uncharacterized protein n=1 Tax=[Actinomadura] parvosata subsp. kistnae TaxID=1909395 RepID=A0A1V0A695_9ACTN|nr:hypothetical protein BKM31_33420 [Nonomuraea sp. ATCC 55076]
MGMSHPDLRFDLLEFSGADACDFAELVDCGEAASVGAELGDACCQDLPYARELLQLVGGRRVEVEHRCGGVGGREGLLRLLASGGAHDDLLAVDQASGQVQ